MQEKKRGGKKMKENWKYIRKADTIYINELDLLCQNIVKAIFLQSFYRLGRFVFIPRGSSACI